MNDLIFKRIALTFVIGNLAIGGYAIALDPPTANEKSVSEGANGAGSASQDSDASADTTNTAAATNGVFWHKTLKNAIKQATEDRKPIFVIVGAPWCSFCEKLELELEGRCRRRAR